MAEEGSERADERVIELELERIEQLFNSIDPAPFPEKDLDDDIDRFLVSWAKEYPDRAPLKVVIHLGSLPERVQPDELCEEALHHYYAYRRELSEREFRDLMRRGRTSLVIGVAFLALCLGASRLLESLSSSPIATIIRESLIIGGWVAMWRPLEILLYDWWPVRRSTLIYEKLAKSAVIVETRSLADGARGRRQTGNLT
ncbi:MAG: hypothetical protein U0263_37220 [Polyangiaceae bacterium]